MDEPTFILRRLSVLETWRQTWNVFMKRYELFLIIASLSYIMIIIFFGATLNVIAGNTDEQEIHKKNAVLFLELCLYHLINIVGHAAMSRGVAEVYVGRVPILHECLMQGLQVLCPLVGVWTLIGLVAAVAYYGLWGIFMIFGYVMGFTDFFFILLFIATVIEITVVLALTSLITPTATIEKLGIIDILKRSLGLISQDLVFILFTIVALDWIRTTVDELIKLILMGGSAELTNSLTGTMISKVTVLLFAPLTSIMQTLIYFNIRIEKEGLNEQVLGQQLEGALLGSPAPVMNPISSPGYTPVSLGASEVSLSGMGGGASNSSPLVSEAPMNEKV